MVQINRYDVVTLLCKRTCGVVQSDIIDPIADNEIVDAFVGTSFIKRAKFKTLKNFVMECGASFQTKIVSIPLSEKERKNFDKRQSSKAFRNVLNDAFTIDTSKAADKGFQLKSSWNFAK